ncbi:hypothetical protein MNBD_NITROSPINAE03-242 [hydrothermal vent metagenome]|uniref:Uncharacterized protein n=1 Tax=hydrothermal vent metagenome TaxID=652676 RepID=A0A3B1C1T8_9ZZZZ
MVSPSMTFTTTPCKTGPAPASADEARKTRRERAKNRAVLIFSVTNEAGKINTSPEPGISESVDPAQEKDNEPDRPENNQHDQADQHKKASRALPLGVLFVGANLRRLPAFRTRGRLPADLRPAIRAGCQA